MTITVIDNHTVITAQDGMFLRSRLDGLYGVSLSLGVYDKPSNYDELPISEWPQAEEESIDNETE